MTKLTLEQQELLFANDCKLINLRYEYHGYTGTEKWAIVTELAEEELWVKYPDVIRRYTPFILLSMAQGEVIDESYRNNDKYEKRAKRTIDVYGYEDDISEQFHRELITPFVDPFEQAEEELWVKYPDVIRRYTPFILLSMAQGEVITEYQNYEARERMRRLLFGHAFDINDGEFEVHHPELAVDTDPIEEIMLKDNIKRLREVLCYLSETQKRRVFKYFFYNKTLEKIADEEGVDFTSVRESVNSAIKKLRKFF